MSTRSLLPPTLYTCACAAIVAAMGMGKASGELWLYEGFQYFPNTMLQENMADPDDPSHSKGFAGGWSNALDLEPDMIADTGLSYLNLRTHGLSLKSYTAPSDEHEWESLTSGNARTVDTTAFPAFGDISTVWISYLVQRNGPIWPGDATSGGDTAYLRLNISSPGRVLSIGELGSADKLGFSVLTQGEATANGPLISLGVGETKLIVFKITLTEGTADLGEMFVNPLLGQADPGVEPIATKTFNFPRLFNSLEFISGYTDTEFIFDELRIGSTYESVTPVPEPTSLLLLGTAGAVLIGSRRRRK